MTANSMIIREQIIVPGAQTITIAPQWYHTKNSGQPSFFPVRHGNFIKPLICGLETKKAVWEAIENAKKSIEISLWGFDPAVMMGGYNGYIEKNIGLGNSLGTNSPRIGDLLLQARGRGVKIKMLNWPVIEHMYNPYWLLKYYKPNILSFTAGNPVLGAVKTSMWLLDKVKELTPEYVSTPEYEQLLEYAQFPTSSQLPDFTRFRDEYEGDPVENRKNIAPNWRYRYNWWKDVTTDENKAINIRHAGFPTTEQNDLALALAVETAGFTKEFAENAPFLTTIALENVETHHQKFVLVDYEIPSQAVAFVMGQNLKAVDGDSFEHPAVAPPLGGRYPNEDPRQDISAKVYGPILYDINANYLKNWKKAQPFLERMRNDPIREKNLSASDFLFTSAETGAKSWPAQFSVTDMGDKKPGSIKDAYDAAIEATTKYFYFENQYFRYDELVKKMKAHAANRFSAQSHEHANPLYYFVVTVIPERMAKGTNYETLKELGHEQQMPEKFSSEYFALIVKLRMFLAISPEDTQGIAKIQKEIDDMDAKRPGQTIPFPFFNNKGPGKVENAEDSFAVQDSEELKGHIVTMMVDRLNKRLILPDKYEYNYINVHSKLALFDDAFAIIGSANLNIRSIYVDAEAVIGTSQEKLAEKLRKELFAGLLGTNEHNDKPISDIYDAWTRILKRNWTAQYKNQALTGTANYFYDTDRFAFPDCD